MELTAEIEKQLERDLIAFGDDLLVVLEASIDKYDLVTSRQLRNSLRRSVIKMGTSHVAARIQFAVQGKFRDMNPKYSNKMPPVEEIIKFIEQEGLSKFKYVPGTKNKVPTDSADKKRIAWGISLSRVRNMHKGPKRKPWKNKRISAAVNELTGKLITHYAHITGLVVQPQK